MIGSHSGIGRDRALRAARVDVAEPARQRGKEAEHAADIDAASRRKRYAERREARPGAAPNRIEAKSTEHLERRGQVD